MPGSTGRVIFEALVSTFSARKSNHVHGKAHNAPPSACFVHRELKNESLAQLLNREGTTLGIFHCSRVTNESVTGTACPACLSPRGARALPSQNIGEIHEKPSHRRSNNRTSRTASLCTIAQSANQPSASTNSNSGPNLAAAQKIKQDLPSAGFTDIKVVAKSFVVQAKSKDGDPVLMTIGPRGMSVFEAKNSSKSDSSSTTGSSSNSMKPGLQNK